MNFRIDRLRALASMAVVALAAAACVAGGPTPSSGSGSGEPAVAGTSPGGASPAAAGTVAETLASGQSGLTAASELSEANNGTSVTVQAGADVRLVLHSIYWANVATSNDAVLALVGSPVFGPGNVRCIPGTGCGAVVTATFHAVAPGTATITAHRTNCAQERPCPSNQQDFKVEVRVVAA